MSIFDCINSWVPAGIPEDGGYIPNCFPHADENISNVDYSSYETNETQASERRF